MPIAVLGFQTGPDQRRTGALQQELKLTAGVARFGHADDLFPRVFQTAQRIHLRVLSVGKLPGGEAVDVLPGSKGEIVSALRRSACGALARRRKGRNHRPPLSLRERGRQQDCQHDHRRTPSPASPHSHSPKKSLPCGYGTVSSGVVSGSDSMAGPATTRWAPLTGPNGISPFVPL